MTTPAAAVDPPADAPPGAPPVIAFDCRLARPGFTFDAAFEAGPGVTALFGPSGAGKSTALALLAGLERPDAGRIALDGAAVVDTERRLWTPAHRRRIAVVFQDSRLFPHLSVRANLLYGRWFTPAAARRVALEPVVEVLGVGHLLDRRPASLSGGERQRIAIGRALLASPRLLLMDEPLASLDADRKLEILPFIERLRDEFAIPIVYVSHSVEEVARLASLVVRLEGGRVVAVGSPAEALPVASLARAADRFEAVSVLTVRAQRWMPDYGVTIMDHDAGVLVAPGRVAEGARDVRVAVPAASVTLSLGRPGNLSMRSALVGRVAAIETDDGPFALITLSLAGGDTLRAFATRLAVDALGLGVGDDAHALIKAVSIDERAVAGLRMG